jgi:hypothetical protein
LKPHQEAEEGHTADENSAGTAELSIATAPTV